MSRTTYLTPATPGCTLLLMPNRTTTAAERSDNLARLQAEQDAAVRRVQRIRAKRDLTPATPGCTVSLVAPTERNPSR